MFRWLENLVDPYAPIGSGPPSSNAWTFVFQHIWPTRYILAASIVLTLIGSSLEVWLIYYSSRLIDALAGMSPAQFWPQLGVELILVAILLLLVRPGVQFLREGLNDIAFIPNAPTIGRWHLNRHVLSQSVGWFRDGVAGSIANHVMSAGAAATGIAYSIVQTLIYVVVYVVGSLLLFASIDLRLIVPILLWMGLYALLTGLAVPLYRKRSEVFQKAASDQIGLMVDTYANIDTVKIFSNRQRDDRLSKEKFEAARQAAFRIQRVEVTINTTMLFLGSLLIVGLVGVSLFLWQAGEAPLGIIAAALALSFRITGMAEWMLDAMSGLFSSLGTLRQALKTAAQPITITDAPDAPALQVTGGTITLTGISHHYGKGAGGLDNLSLDIAPGEKVGLVGRSGAGKSTLVNLILRFFEAEKGQIAIDGQDIIAVTQDSLRAQIGMVTQDPALLHRSVRDNIAYGQAEIAEDRLHEAARKAEAHDFILGLEDAEHRKAYDAHVGERGVKLSGGQRQRIALARVILKNAPILILDEATSALDSEVEAAIQDSLDTIMAGKTVIAIAHRLSTIARMDRIVVVDQGRVAEQGTHEKLLKSGGIYAHLWARQSGGYIGTE